MGRSGHLTRQLDGSQLILAVYYNGELVANQSANGSGSSDVWGFNLGPLYAAGTWKYEFTDIGGNVLAAGQITAH
ncbi:MAG TPA: hypothetical protein VKR30_11995 [Candidatus Limnocylindrales bacterium]|nr:hypothetical protein [Candidatus Limnocylindrales bacterium]